VEMRFKQYAQSASLPEEVTPRTLRHSIAYHYLQQDMSIKDVQKLLGNVNLAPIAVYTKLTAETPDKIVAEVSTALD
jgi:site-specific recombinase XerD